MTILPTCNQIAVSPFVYRPEIIDFYEKQNIEVGPPSCGWNGRERCRVHFQNALVHPAQIIIRWAFQKRLIVVVKTSQVQRMKENRSTFHFILSEEEMQALDSLTSPKTIAERAALEIKRRNGV